VDRYFYTVLDLKVKDIPSQESVIKWMNKAAASFGFIVLTYAQSAFQAPVPGNAYTIVAVLSASHMVIHTAPESEWVEIVFALCKEIPKGDLLESVREFWNPELVKVSSFMGGVPEV